MKQFRIEGNIPEIVKRYRDREERVWIATRFMFDELSDYIKKRAISLSRHTAYNVNKRSVAFTKRNKDGTFSSAIRRYPYARRYSANGPPLHNDALINMQSGLVNRSWMTVDFSKKSGDNGFMLINTAPHARFVFSRRGTRIGKGGMRPRPIWAMLLKMARGHQWHSKRILWSGLLCDADELDPEYNL